MNGSYYNNPTFPNDVITKSSPPGNISSMSIPLEQSLIENILRLNKGSEVCVYASYPDSNEWRDKKTNQIYVEDFEIQDYDYNKEINLGKIPVAEEGDKRYVKYNSSKS